ncbi:hypothetical protein AAFF_G00116310 [Aldrovandia affinis]|uniref:Uncharacterized protein n=1 Tax=Aldrovandia affinis TaxID=143900 RepID=A0AAD7WXI1_9TELE|nr:hypothetical protein AAFF_G00116310 [Aldrovandia affinis]
MSSASDLLPLRQSAGRTLVTGNQSRDMCNQSRDMGRSPLASPTLIWKPPRRIERFAMKREVCLGRRVAGSQQVWRDCPLASAQTCVSAHVRRGNRERVCRLRGMLRPRGDNGANYAGDPHRAQTHASGGPGGNVAEAV